MNKLIVDDLLYTLMILVYTDQTIFEMMHHAPTIYPIDLGSAASQQEPSSKQSKINLFDYY